MRKWGSGVVGRWSGHLSVNAGEKLENRLASYGSQIGAIKHEAEVICVMEVRDLFADDIEM